jgi:hypothetical protein
MMDAAFIENGHIYNVADSKGGVSPILIISLEGGQFLGEGSRDVWVYWDIKDEKFNWFAYSDPFFLMRLRLVENKNIINNLVNHIHSRIPYGCEGNSSWKERDDSWMKRFVKMIDKMRSYAQRDI